MAGPLGNTSDPVSVDAPPLPERRSSHRLPLALGTGALGAGTAVGVFVVAKSRGRNRVAAGGAAAAAYGDRVTDDEPFTLVADAALARMATTEFVPPEIDPWEARLLLTERIDNQSVGAWFAGHVGKEVLELEPGPPPVLRPGPNFEDADLASGRPLRALFKKTDELKLNTYRPALGTAWNSVHALQVKAAKESGWWHRYPPGTQASFPIGVVLPVGLCAVAVGIGWWSGWFQSVPLTLAFAVALPALAAMAGYHALLPSRSPAGSALALRAESFRRFLMASEGQHVEWAWSRGLLREYTAWAVALGAAEAWGDAVQRSTVPPAEATALMSPIILHTQRGSVHSAHTKPSQSGGSGGGSGGGWSSGGFSSGSVGGGGGGGSSGSW
ncbi:MAG TPA: hypothetical protein DCR14_12155 [Acidimicrobiaceae bacterium]|nr:hypothetical protein [Acidimicrobiaceae bacterium]